MTAKEILEEIKKICETTHCEECPFYYEYDCQFEIGFGATPSNWAIKEQVITKITV